MMRKNWTSVLLFCLITTCCTAQTAGYKFYAPLDSIKISGFYNIEIKPELSSKINTYYSDLRIVNDSGKWVPHIFHWSYSEGHDSILYESLRIIKKETDASNTILVIAADNELVGNLTLQIRNTTAERFCTISGSDDAANWFVINDSLLINPLPDPKSTSNVFEILFPPNNYKFFKIVIYNKNKPPFDIKAVMQSFITSVENSLHTQVANPECNIEQKDSGKISYIKVRQQQSFHFDYIDLKIAGIKYFSRKVDLYIPTSGNHSFSNPGQLWQSFTISNNNTLQLKLETSNAPVFYLLIHNEDNLPLGITEVSTAADYRYMTAYLEKGGSYKLIMNNPSATPPNYDLAKTNTKISDSIPFISFGKIIAVEQTPTSVVKIKNNNWILWAAIIAVLFILLLFTRKMVKEVDKRKEHDSI
jgi:hypothetical protein